MTRESEGLNASGVSNMSSTGVLIDFLGSFRSALPSIGRTGGTGSWKDAIVREFRRNVSSSVRSATGEELSVTIPGSVVVVSSVEGASLVADKEAEAEMDGAAAARLRRVDSTRVQGPSVSSTCGTCGTKGAATDEVAAEGAVGGSR